MPRNKATSRLSTALVVFIIAYLGIGLGFHVKWRSERDACREMQGAQGDFDGVLGLAFDITNWPFYALANVYHYGTPFATPCTHPENAEALEEVRQVVEDFGERLKAVSLQSPDAAQEIKEQYAGFVSPELLAAWMEAPSTAPGRIVSSPWPERIEIVSVVSEGTGRYAITGFVVEVTSVELVNGGAAAKTPVHLIVEKRGDRWLISEYNEDRQGSSLFSTM